MAELMDLKCSESADKIVFFAGLPEFRKDQIKIKHIHQSNTLSVQATISSDNTQRYTKSLTGEKKLPTSADRHGIKAEFDGILLKVTIKKNP
jgi:HSP20 family molecular chaperone IbpA